MECRVLDTYARNNMNLPKMSIKRHDTQHNSMMLCSKAQSFTLQDPVYGSKPRRNNRFVHLSAVRDGAHDAGSLNHRIRVGKGQSVQRKNLVLRSPLRPLQGPHPQNFSFFVTYKLYQ
jgi:hypothetical protein